MRIFRISGLGAETPGFTMNTGKDSVEAID